MSKPETVDDLAKKLSLEAEGLLAPFGLPSGDKYKGCMENLVDYTIEALTDWLDKHYNKPIDECLELIKDNTKRDEAGWVVCLLHPDVVVDELISKLEAMKGS